MNWLAKKIIGVIIMAGGMCLTAWADKEKSDELQERIDESDRHIMASLREE